MPGMPIGIDDFADLRRLKFDYVDKTPYIDKILREGFGVFQFTRPRRFGKSLNLSTIDCYLNIKYRGNDWFDGLRISEMRPDDPEKNSYPVIRVDLQMLSGSSYKLYRSDLSHAVGSIYSGFTYLLDSDRLDEVQKDCFRSYWRREAEADSLVYSVKYLSEMLERHHGRKAVILMDEYDSAINRIKDRKVGDKISDMHRRFMQSTFKENGSLEFGVMTGIMQLAKEGMFSGMNGVRVNNILTDGYDEYFGFTESEVLSLLEKHGHPEKLEEVRGWYDGYRFGGAEIYNPWSILNYISSGFKPGSYWANTGDNSIMLSLLDRREMYDQVMSLASGGSFVTEISPDVTFSQLDRSDKSLFHIMAMAGYLKTVPQEDGNYEVSIPNMEMLDIFRRMATESLPAGYDGRISRLLTAFREDDVPGVQESLGELFGSMSSFRILKHESDYHNFLYGLLVGAAKGYRPSAEGESGDGYYDIRLESTRPENHNILMEIKRLDKDATDSAAAKAAEKALEQIVGKRYQTGLEGRTSAYAVVFRSKRPLVRMVVL